MPYLTAGTSTISPDKCEYGPTFRDCSSPIINPKNIWIERWVEFRMTVRLYYRIDTFTSVIFPSVALDLETPRSTFRKRMAR